MRFSTAALVALCVTLTACSSADESFITNDTGAFRALHAIPDADSLDLRLGTRELNPVSFKGVSGLSAPGPMDVNLNVSVEMADGTSSELLSVAVNTDTDTESVLVMYGSTDAPEALQWQQPARNWAEEEEAAGGELSVIGASFGHALPGLGSVDVYLDEPGFDPLASTPLGSLAFGNFLPEMDVSDGDYEFVLTTAGDPADELFRSAGLSFGSGISIFFIIIDDGGIGTGTMVVKTIGNGLLNELTDVTLPATMRSIHAASDTGAVDVYLDEDLETTFAAGISFGDVGDYVDVPVGDEVPLTVTPAGDTSVLLVENTLDLNAGGEHTFFLIGNSGEETAIRSTDNNRRVATQARLRVINAASDFGLFDIYLLEPGATIAETASIFIGLGIGGSTGYQLVIPGEYDLVFAENGTDTLVGGPFRVQLNGSGVYGVLTVDDEEMTGIDILQFDDIAMAEPATDR